MSDEDKEETIKEEDEYGNILFYPAWSKKNPPKDRQDKWEVPIYIWDEREVPEALKLISSIAPE